MRPSNFIRLSAFLGLCALPFQAQAQDAPVPTQLDNLRNSTSLDRDGLPPWHLRISFQLYSLEGKKQDTGTIEEWWASAHQRRIVITSPAIPEGSHETTRASFLAGNLLSSMVHPVPLNFAFKDQPVKREDRTVGKIKLSCLVVSGPLGGDSLCTNPDTYDLRLVLEPGAYTVIRNRAARFLNTQIDLDTTLEYNDLPAISGHIETLESFDPAKLTPPFVPDPAPDPVVVATGSHPARLSGGVMAGRILKKMTPVYPMEGKEQHLSGTVMLHALITRQGTIASLAVIASPSPVLSAAATDAVKQWQYQPYLLNGQPTEVDTTITVNFNLNSR